MPFSEFVRESLDYVAAGGGAHFFAFFVIFFMFIAWRVGVHAISAALDGDKKKNAYAIQLAISSATVISVFFFVMFLLGVVIHVVDHLPTAEHVAHANTTLYYADHEFLGILAPLSLHTGSGFGSALEALRVPMFHAYTTLGIIMAITALLFLTIRPKEFLQMGAAFAIATSLSAPFWIMFPAISPLEGFVDDKIGMTMPEEVSRDLSLISWDEKMDELLSPMRIFWKSGENGFYAITSFPSMHIAWATILLFYGAMFSRLFFLILIPHFILNALSTVYFLQHYAVDIPLGIAIGLLAALISLFAIRSTPRDIAYVSEETRRSIVRFASILRIQKSPALE